MVYKALTIGLTDELLPDLKMLIIQNQSAICFTESFTAQEASHLLNHQMFHLLIIDLDYLRSIQQTDWLTRIRHNSFVPVIILSNTPEKDINGMVQLEGAGSGERHHRGSGAGAGGSGRGAAAIPGEQGSGGFLRGVRQAPHWENWIRLPYGKDGYRRRACARERMPSCGGCFRAAAFLRKNDKIVHKKKDSGQKSTLHFRDRKSILCRK